jgi:biotin operon repressor
MSMQAIAFAGTLPVFERGAKFTLMQIAYHVSVETGQTFVGQDLLARETACSARTIRRDLDTLEEAGFITRQERRAGGRRSTDTITLVGYLDWQQIIESGGFVPDPKTRGKRIDSVEEIQPDRLSGRAVDKPSEAKSVQPDTRGHSTGHQRSFNRTLVSGH